MNSVDVAAGAAIRLHRLDRKLTQQELAEKVGTSQSALAKWERGEAPMRLRDCVAVCEALGVGLGELWETPKSEAYQEGVQHGLRMAREALERISK